MTRTGWSTTKQTEFVNAYAHRKNPTEDMAESIAYFVINPDKLRSRSPGKYEFVRDRIMQGGFYISKIREDLTFEVYNLYPDYVYPGKIRRVDIEVTGAPEDDKNVRIEIELHAWDGELEGATKAYTRIFSEIGTFTDLSLYPVGVPHGAPGTVLSGSFTLSKYAKAGYWSPDQIRLSDAHSNERFGGINDFGWRLYVNNPLEDITPPQYVRNSLALSQSTAIVEDREVQVIEATWEVVEDSGIVDCAGFLVVEIPGTSTRRYRRDGYSYRMGGLHISVRPSRKVSAGLGASCRITCPRGCIPWCPSTCMTWPGTGLDLSSDIRAMIRNQNSLSMKPVLRSKW